MSVTPNMSLTLPAVGSDSTWATELTNNFSAVIDSHAHSTGQGLQLGAPALNINADVAFGNNNLNGVSSLTLSARAPASVLTPLSLFSDGMDLYFTDANGNAVQLTQGGTLQSSLPGAFFIGAPSVPGTISYTIQDTDPWVVWFTNVTAGSLTLTLPNVSTNNGRFVIVKDTGSATGSHVVTVAAQSGQFIDVSSTSKTITTARGVLRLYCDSQKWWTV